MAFVEIDNLGVLGYVATHFGNLNFQIFHFLLFWTSVKNDYPLLHSVPYSLTPFPSETSMPPT